MDTMVLTSQKWLNETYSGNSGYNIIDEDGYTGWGTINALIRALQIELNISPTADNFGPTTISVFNATYPSGISQQADGATAENNIYGIIQCALWCKGYSTGSATITKHFYGGTGNAIKQLKTHMGIPSDSSVITLNVMKALLSMDQFQLISGGNPQIQEIQRSLNSSYENYIGIIPCDGYYGRSMNTALIKSLQAIEGLSPSAANGNFGPATQSLVPILTSTAPLDTEELVKYHAAIKLFRFCLICNGYSISPTVSFAWNTELSNAIHDFQTNYALPVTGKGDLNTWMSLLLSKGNPDRSALACDTSEILDFSKATALYNNGYRYVGRYLTGTVGSGASLRPKNLSKSELDDIFDAGLRVFAIFQEGAVYLSKFTYEQGKIDGARAINAALSLGIPLNEIIYFAIDYDVMDGQISNYILEYFRGIKSVFTNNNNKYRIGIYGARNVCSRVAYAGYSVSSFVSDMSTGFSGNMGYIIPSDWAFDQFHEYTFTSGNISIALDKVAYSGRYSGFNTITDNTLEIYKDLLEMFRVTPPVGLSFDQTYTISTPILHTEFTASLTSTFSVDTADAIAALNITDGSFDATLLNNTEAEIADISTELSASFDDAGGFDMITSISNKLIDATVSVGVGVSAGFLRYTYIIEKPLNDSNNTTLSFKIVFIFRNQPADAALIASYKLCAVATVSAIAIIAACYFIGLTSESLITIIGNILEHITLKANN